jgi:hypothetical protein
LHELINHGADIDMDDYVVTLNHVHGIRVFVVALKRHGFTENYTSVNIIFIKHNQESQQTQGIHF